MFALKVMADILRMRDSACKDHRWCARKATFKKIGSDKYHIYGGIKYYWYLGREMGQGIIASHLVINSNTHIKVEAK
jgi:hypothetical protein